MVQPPGFETTDKTLVCKLGKPLYGLKQTPCTLFDKLTTTLFKFNFRQSKCNSSLFMRVTSTDVTYMLVYVDDIIVIGSSPHFIYDLKKMMHKKFALKELGTLRYFIGIEATTTPTGDLVLSQHKYISDLLKKAGMSNTKPTTTPMIVSPNLTPNSISNFHNPHLYRSIVGSLHYATITHPKIKFAMNKVSQFMMTPTEDHWKAVKRILQYLKGTLTCGLKFTRG